MGVYFKEADKPTRPIYLQCDRCGIEIKIVTILEIQKYYDKGWTRGFFNTLFCFKCSYEHKIYPRRKKHERKTKRIIEGIKAMSAGY